VPDRALSGVRVANLADGRSHPLDAGRIGDLAVFDRHVEIDTHEHALTCHVGLIERVEHVVLIAGESGHLGYCNRGRCKLCARVVFPYMCSWHLM
jgi:hypothetical protein